MKFAPKGMKRDQDECKLQETPSYDHGRAMEGLNIPDASQKKVVQRTWLSRKTRQSSSRSIEDVIGEHTDLMDALSEVWSSPKSLMTFTKSLVPKILDHVGRALPSGSKDILSVGDAISLLPNHAITRVAWCMLNWKGHSVPGGIIADEMGVGKTRLAITAILLRIYY
ncbi:hypothetical protein DL771_003098 [Monosporascus sp. 5C6A]|nr:hypothetical protein DL771_003098 [Monosporascus sp. 5C6A]